MRLDWIIIVNPNSGEQNMVDPDGDMDDEKVNSVKMNKLKEVE